MIKDTSLRPFDRIAFVGQMGAGKDAIALEIPHANCKFATALRQVVTILRDNQYMCRNLLRNMMQNRFRLFDVEDILTEALTIPKTKKDRGVEQFIGTSLRKLDDLIWVRSCLEDIHRRKNSLVVITDVRRLMELNTLRQEGFILFYIDAPYEVRLQRCVARDEVTPEEFLEASQHEAEREIESLKPLCDYVIDNSGESLEFVSTQLDRIMKGAKEKWLLV